MTPQGGGNDSRSKAPPHAGGAADGRAANGKATATGGLHRLHLWQIQAVRDVLVMGLVLGLVWAGYAMRAVTVPLLVALTLAYLFEPPIAALTHRWRASRPLVVGGLLLTVGAAVLVLLTLAVPLIIGQTVRLLDEIREGRFQKTALRLREFVPADYQADFDQAARWFGLPAQDSEVRGQKSEVSGQRSEVSADLRPLTSDDEHLREVIRQEIAAMNPPASPADGPSAAAWWNLARSGGRAVFAWLGTIVQLGLLAFLIPFYFFFFSVSYPAVANFGRDLIPIVNRPRALELIGKMDRAVAGFVRGRIVICVLVAVMLAIGWLIVGVPYSIVLGLVVGVFGIVPFLAVIGIPLAVGLMVVKQLGLPAAEQYSWWWVLFAPVIPYLVAQAIENYILTPVIAGKATNLDPVTILVAVLAGGSVGGVYGMILAIPVAACLKILCTDVFLPKVRAWTAGRAADPLP